MYAEDDLLPISGLQHLLFCERQCALIHVEGQWLENRFTAEGRVSHERVHAGGGRAGPNVRQAFALHLRSLEHGLSGVADVVEFHRAAPGRPWRPFPVEHKRGRPKRGSWDTVQLCVQALCLEEMLGQDVPCGALFYGATRRRLEVAFDETLRREAAQAALRFHQLVESGLTPPARYDPKKCDTCSLAEVCLPRSAASRQRRVRDYLDQALLLSDPQEGGAP
uniref:CRISPR-associated exonuclease Cas4 n=1 Tax=Fundidesulfovibrio putealis TaxID=270496 RepID=A0A7C4AHN3_9BACT